MPNGVVTGAGTGIGRAVAAALVADGYEVTITGRRGDILNQTASEIGARAVSFDASDVSAIERVLSWLPARVDVLVHAAGGNTDFDLPDATDLASEAARWQANFAGNVLSAVLVTHALRDRLQDAGRVISFGSIGAEKPSGAYGAAKAAAQAWNTTIASELGKRGITCNVIAPGYIEETEFFRDRMTSQRRDALRKATLVDRNGVPEDVVGLVRYLVSPAGAFLTGQTLHLNGGAFTTR